MNNFPIQSTQSNIHTLILKDGKEYDTYKLIHLTSDIELITVDMPYLRANNLWKKCWSDVCEKRIAPIQLLVSYRTHGSWEKVRKKHPGWANHIERVQTADCKYPLLMYDGQVIDGIHRIIRADIDGLKVVPVRMIVSLPAEAIYKQD